MRAESLAPWGSFRGPARVPATRWVGALAFITGSLALHVLMFGAVIWGDGGRSSVLESRQGMGANQFGAPEEAITTIFFVEDSSATEKPDVEELASAGQIPQSLRVTIVSPDSSTDSARRDRAVDEHHEVSEEATLGEREARAALFGTYIGQIEARIERAWLRPRSPIGAELFECRVQVQQSERGFVLEVTLKQCNGDTRWQLSLVNAVQGASPLPAPPDPAVFSSAIDLSFSSVAFAPERTEQGYEPPPVAALNNTH